MEQTCLANEAITYCKNQHIRTRISTTCQAKTSSFIRANFGIQTPFTIIGASFLKICYVYFLKICYHRSLSSEDSYTPQSYHIAWYIQAQVCCPYGYNIYWQLGGQRNRQGKTIRPKTTNINEEYAMVSYGRQKTLCSYHLLIFVVYIDHPSTGLLGEGADENITQQTMA